MIPAFHILAAKLADAAYIRSPTDLRNAFQALGVTYDSTIITDECTCVLGTYIENGNQRYVVVLSGTHFTENTDPAEIKDNLDFTPVIADSSAPLALVARGYWQPLMKELPQILGFITMEAPVYCIGHSLGGVRANLLCAVLAARGYTVQAISYGAPKGANAVFWEAHPGSYYRYVNQRDPAPDWPLDVLSDMTHPAPMEWLWNDGLISNGDFFRHRFVCISDHWIEKYIAKLEAFSELA